MTDERFITIRLQREVFESLEGLLGSEMLVAIAKGEVSACQALGPPPNTIQEMDNLFMLLECVLRAAWRATEEQAAEPESKS